MMRIIFPILLSLIFLTSCKEENNISNPEEETILSDKITIGETVEEATGIISTDGGNLVVTNPDSKINGLTITVPEQGYNETKNYIISSAPITNHKLGGYFTPISPLITIQNGGGYSEMPIKIKVPIKKEADEFLVGFLFNEITGELETLPLIEFDDSFATVETRHFSLSTLNSNSILPKISEISSRGNLVISSIKESLLAGQSVISSGFAPGLDDWEFINYGSFISPGGHCAGQSMTAMWYYYEKRLKGEIPLFHRFDEINDRENPNLLWQDNPLGYRFASTVQEDANWGDWVKALNIQSNYPNLVWKTFIAAMLITGEPQSVIIRNSGSGGGHAMIVYKINVTEGKLYIADPNYPNNRSSSGEQTVRIINFKNGYFDPYPSFAKVGDPGTLYDQIAFFAKTSTFDWGKIGERYKELENGTIGNDRFKNYNLFLKTKNDSIPFLDGMTVTNDTIKLFCRNDKIPGFLPGTSRRQEIYIYDKEGIFLSSTDDDGLVMFRMNQSSIKLGINIFGYIDVNLPNSYYDFKWVTLKYEPPDPNPNELTYTKCIVGAQVLAKMHYETDEIDSTYTEVFEVGSYSITGSFSGNTFSGVTEQFGSKQTVNITVNAEHNMVTNIVFTHLNESSFNSGYVLKEFTGKNIPVKSNDESEFRVDGVNTCSSITEIYYIADNGGTAITAMESSTCNEFSHVFVKFN